MGAFVSFKSHYVLKKSVWVCYHRTVFQTGVYFTPEATAEIREAEVV